MNLGTNEQGRPLLSTNRIRRYGAGGFEMYEGQAQGGCPAQYRAHYETYKTYATARSEPLIYGGTIHDALHAMENDAIGPEQALERVWPAELPIERLREATDDLNKYMERGGPMVRYGTMATEVTLEAPLYEDEDFGWVYFMGILDWIGIDVERTGTLHVVDYKAGFTIPKREDVLNDVQLLGYEFLVRANWTQLGMTGKPDVVCHLDAIKWRDLEVKFSAQQIEDWQIWASAVARRILRDEEAEPRVNPGCGWCEVKLDCKAFRKLPGRGLGYLEKRTVAHLDKLVPWRDQAKETVKHLTAAIKEVDSALAERVALEGSFRIGDTEYYEDRSWSDVVDRRELAEVLGDAYFALAQPTKTALDQWLKVQGDEQLTKAVKACFERQPTGTTIKKRKVDDPSPPVP